jgi:hypothetical protein
MVDHSPALDRYARLAEHLSTKYPMTVQSAPNFFPDPFEQPSKSVD